MRALPDAAFLKLALAPYRGRMLAALRRASWAKSEHFEFEVTGVPGVERVALFAWPEPLGRARRVAVDVVRYDDDVLEKPVRFGYELLEHERPAAVEEVPPRVLTVDAAAISAMDRATWPVDRPDTVTTSSPSGSVVWTLVTTPGLEREVQKLDERGMPILGTVDTAVSCYRMVCGRCGRVRYARPNGLHQISLCRVCTRTERLRKRALTQYKKRRAEKKA